MTFTKTTLSILLSLLFFAQNTEAQTINFPDANLKKALLKQSPKIDKNGDGEIQKSEAQNYEEELELTNASIKNLEGIQYFKKVESLDVSRNPLSDNGFKPLSVTYMQMLAEDRVDNDYITLTEIYCDACDLQNVNMGSFALEDATTMDFSRNPRLRMVELNPDQKKYETLNLKDCPSLVSLNVGDLLNENFFIDLEGNTKMKCIYVTDTKLAKKMVREDFLYIKGLKVELSDSPCY